MAAKTQAPVSARRAQPATHRAPANPEEVHRILSDIRKQYDHVHMEAEKREAELVRLREAVRVADQPHGGGLDESSKTEEMRTTLERQIEDTRAAIKEGQTATKVYTHMCGRIQKEQSLLKEKLLIMEGHLQRKGAEHQRKVALHERIVRKGAQCMQDVEFLERDLEQEQAARAAALEDLDNELQAKKDARERREQFEKWRHEVALLAATEAFNASAGRLRKIYAVEKLAGNCLQKITFEQVERSQNTEDGFQKIREVTGLTDVMDIVHKFLSRDMEHDQLKSSVKDAEAKLEKLREENEKLKADTDGAYDSDIADRSRVIYLEVEQYENKLSQALKEHAQSREKLQQSTLQVEHMKRWANRMSKSMAIFEDKKEVDGPRVEKPADLIGFFEQLKRAVDKFIVHIVQQISSGKVQRKNMSQVASKEYHEARRLLADRDFLKANCRVPPSLDAGRPPSRQGNNVEDDSQEAYNAERAKCKKESEDKAEALRKQVDHQKKKGAK